MKPSHSLSLKPSVLACFRNPLVVTARYIIPIRNQTLPINIEGTEILSHIHKQKKKPTPGMIKPVNKLRCLSDDLK